MMGQPIIKEELCEILGVPYEEESENHFFQLETLNACVPYLTNLVIALFVTVVCNQVAPPQVSFGIGSYLFTKLTVDEYLKSQDDHDTLEQSFKV